MNIHPLTTYTFVSKDDAIRVMDGDLSISDALEMGLCTAETRPYTVAELRAQIATSYTQEELTGQPPSGGTSGPCQPTTERI